MSDVELVRRPVLIAGPTASGKSAVALRLAERDVGCVINADAAQVYACWRVLTARPAEDEIARAPHRLYGHVSCATRYSVGAWLRDVSGAIEAARELGLRPIIVGGTGLYLTALVEGLSQIPEISAAVRARSQALLDSGETDVFLRELERGDPETFARMDRRNPMRLQRAWEVLTETGRGLAAWHKSTAAPLVTDADRILIMPEKSFSNSAIESRFRMMLKEGALDECRAFLNLSLDRSLPAGRVIGAAPLIEHVAGERSLENAVALAVTATRQFAKRQRTWFRRRMSDWKRLDPGAGDPLGQIPGD